LGDINKEKLPGLSALKQKGKKDGQVIMVKNGGSVEAHQWSLTTQSWSKIGDVVNAVSQSQKQTFEGIEYDYVFDVDIEEGAPPLKLPYNVSQNPYEAAQRFLENHGLEMGYIDQVVKFIEANTGGVKLGGGGSAVDPYSSSRYIPGTSSGYQPSPDPYIPTVTRKHLPQRSYLSFKVGELGVILNKMNTFNTEVPAENVFPSISS
jgi:phospholipase A-2-activating protein